MCQPPVLLSCPSWLLSLYSCYGQCRLSSVEQLFRNLIVVAPVSWPTFQYSTLTRAVALDTEDFLFPMPLLFRTLFARCPFHSGRHKTLRTLLVCAHMTQLISRFGDLLGLTYFKSHTLTHCFWPGTFHITPSLSGPRKTL